MVLRRQAYGAGNLQTYQDGHERQRFKIGIRVSPTKRLWQHLPPGTSEAMARTVLESLQFEERQNGRLREQELARQGLGGEHETLEAYCARFIAARKGRLYSCYSEDEGRLRLHVWPLKDAAGLPLGQKPVRKIGRGDMERLVARLNQRVRDREMSWKSADCIWCITRTLFRWACGLQSRRELPDPSLVVRDDNPTDSVLGPVKGYRKARTYLYPSEFWKLVTCKAIPVQWRRVYVLAAYTLSRVGELLALRWTRVRRDHGVIEFAASLERKDRTKVKVPKNGEFRRIPIEPTLEPLIDALWEERTSDDGFVIMGVSRHDRVALLREHMRLAGITRPDLFPPPDRKDPTAWAPLTFHDLRGTGITWMAIRGDDPLKIMQRAGHKNFRTTQAYLRESETLGHDPVPPFPPLPADLLGSKIRSKTRERSANPPHVNDAQPR